MENNQMIISANTLYLMYCIFFLLVFVVFCLILKYGGSDLPKKQLFEKRHPNSCKCTVSGWVAYDFLKLEKRPPKSGKYFVHRKDGKVHWETWNGSGWAYNGNVITFWMEVIPPCEQIRYMKKEEPILEGEVYLVKKGNKYMKGHGYSTMYGYNFNWTSNKKEARRMRFSTAISLQMSSGAGSKVIT